MLTSLQNPLVKQMRKLHRGKERREQQLFLLEGTHLIEEALASTVALDVACCTASWQERYPKLWEQIQQQSRRVELVSPEVLEAIATTVHPDGIVATAGRVLPCSPSHAVSLGLAIETLQDPGNLGTLIRTAAAAGVDGFWLSEDSVDLDHPKVLRATAGQWFRIPMAISSDLRDDVARCQSNGVQVLATLPTASLPYWEIDLKRPTLLLLGNEGAGLSAELTEMADKQVSIPLATGVESLNVAIAAAILLFEAQRQRRAEH
ncbi:MAG TPA: RNA methyltransferase [Crinalium sp.]